MTRSRSFRGLVCSRCSTDNNESCVSIHTYTDMHERPHIYYTCFSILCVFPCNISECTVQGKWLKGCPPALVTFGGDRVRMLPAAVSALCLVAAALTCLLSSGGWRCPGAGPQLQLRVLSGQRRLVQSRLPGVGMSGARSSCKSLS